MPASLTDMHTVDEMKINGERMLADLYQLRTITDTPGAGVSRFSYGEKDGQARAYITQVAETAGFVVRADAIGNLFIYPGNVSRQYKGDIVELQDIDEAEASDGRQNEPRKIRIGSHIDTVRNGGWLDGVYGVIAGLEAMRTLQESGLQGNSEIDDVSSEHPSIELVIFAEEEGSNFGSTMTGSKFAAGIYGEEELDSLQNDQGTSLRQMLQQGGFPQYQREEVVWDFDQVQAMLEIHIEQGPVLERKGLSIGVVDVVYGMWVVEFTLQGVGNHAGATPMRDRQDALVAAALSIAEAEGIANEDAEGTTVATVGKINVSPNCSNVIPEKVVFALEVRDKDADRIRLAMEKIKERIRGITGQRNVGCEIREVAHSAPIKMDESLKSLIAELASRAGFSYEIMNSGAVHDTCMVAPYAPAGMIFVPSKGGRSHVPFEDTDEEDLVRGAQLLLDTIRAI